jgi:hypothetical protein
MTRTTGFPLSDARVILRPAKAPPVKPGAALTTKESFAFNTPASTPGISDASKKRRMLLKRVVLFMKDLSQGK